MLSRASLNQPHGFGAVGLGDRSFQEVQILSNEVLLKTKLHFSS